MTEQPNYELLKEAYVIIDGVPDYLFDLRYVACGSLACAAGWLAQHPKFQALGLSIEGNMLEIDGTFMDYDEAMAAVFRLDTKTAWRLFTKRQQGEYGGFWPKSDKALWQLRVRTFLAAEGQL